LTTPASNGETRSSPPGPENGWPRFGFSRLSFDTGEIARTAILLIVLACVITPLAFLILGSFSNARLPGEFSFANLSLKNHISVWSSPISYNVFLNTLIYALGSTFFGLAFAITLAWLIERCDLPGKIWIYAAIPITLAMPGMLQAMAWVVLLSPKIGFFNKLLMQTFALESAPFNIYSLPGMIFVESIRLVPTAFLMLVPLLKGMDPSFEEAAAMSGASARQRLFKVSLPLLLPGLLAIAIFQFITALEIFEIPGILGLPSGIFVFSTRIYSTLHSSSFLPNYGEANALSLVYLIIALASTLIYARVLTQAGRYSTISGKGFRPRMQALGRWRWPAFMLVMFYLLIAVILPVLVLAFISFMPFLQTPSFASLSRLTLDNYRTLFETDAMGQVLMNTLWLVVVTSTATVLVSFIIALIVVRSRFWGRRLLDQLAFLPHSIPGIVMGLAMLWIFLKLDKMGIGLFGTIWSVCIVFTIGFMSYGTRAMNAALLQVHQELEEAGLMSGANFFTILRRILLPLLLPACVGVWIWTALHAARMASQPLLLTEGHSNEVLAVMVWNLWGEGQSVVVGAIGTLMVLFLMGLTLVMRWLSSARA
jgi:iron(III) transport system permease protein